MTDTLLRLTDVSKAFPQFSLENISFSLPKGYIMGLIGPNGAGKTTLIKLILNMVEKDSGEILVSQKDHAACERTLKQEIGVVFDSSFFVEEWTVKDTERAISVFYQHWDHALFQQMIRRFELPWNKKISDLSRGMQMKLMLACAFSHDAKLLILDEPTSGLDPATRSAFLEVLQDYIKDGQRSVLFSTHITADLERVADYVVFLHEGRLVYTGSMEELLNRYRLIKGRPQDLTPALERRIVGLRKTDLSFEGLLAAEEAAAFSAEPNKSYVLDHVTADDVLVGFGRRD